MWTRHSEQALNIHHFIGITFVNIKMTIRIVHKYIMLHIWFIKYARTTCQYYYSEIYNLQMGIAGRRHTAMRLPDNITKNVCSIIKLYDHVPSVIWSIKVSFSVTRMIMLISTPLQQLGDESMWISAHKVYFSVTRMIMLISTPL